MREKWNKTEFRRTSEGQPVAHRIAMFDDSTYVPKLVQKAPSMRAIKNYNNIATDFQEQPSPGPEDDCFVTSQQKELESGRFAYPPAIVGHIFTTDEPYDYPTIKSSSAGTFAGSESGTDRVEELGSTSKLVASKMQMSCTKYYKYAEVVFCAISIANGLGNVYRLPQAVIRGGGLPFLIAYIILALLIGLPLLFLEIGVGQIVQEGFTKTWRAVPFFKGIGYVKLFAGCLLCLYYPLYMALALYYAIWVGKGQLPFTECALVRLKATGYEATGILGQDCLEKTFFTSPFTDPEWYGIFAGLLLSIWIILLVICIKRRQFYTKVLLLLSFPTLACLLALSIKALMLGGSLDDLTENVDWSLLGTSRVWYFAAVQVFFSTQIGFGTFVTNAGVLFEKANPYWTTFGYMFVNLVVGVLSVLVVYVYGQGVPFMPLKKDSLQEFNLLIYIYDVGLAAVSASSPESSQAVIAWMTVAYCTILFAGFISMVTIIYIILKAITIETKHKLRWWQVTSILSFLGFLLCAIVSLDSNFRFVHILDYYVVSNLVLITVIIEIFTFVAFYGSNRILLDFEFISGSKLSKVWIGLWYIAPFVLLVVFLWGLATTGPYLDADSMDPEWVYIFSWSVIVIALLFIIYIGMYVVNNQDEYYTFVDKFKASFKSSRNWGPIDPIFRFDWVQWHSKAKDGERDFTLKRRGTKDYAHSVKKRSKKSYAPTAASDVLTTSGSIAFHHHNDQNQNGLTASGEPFYFTASIKNDVRPLSVTPAQMELFDDTKSSDTGRSSAEPDTYGTFRKGPYVISDADMGHVCHRKYHEISTEL